MKLPGQGRRRQHGYAMAALLVAMSIMAVMLTVAMPVWKHAAQREKEEELVFRGLQYAHAIGLYQRKYANAYPPSIDVLVEQRFLRKKYKDPITNDDFQPIPAGANVPGATTGAQRGTAGARGSTVTSPAAGAQTSGAGRGGVVPGTPGATVAAGISGVTSKSKDQSIRLYNGRSHYNEWAFIHLAQVQQPGAGAAGVGAPGQTGRGQTGQPQPPNGQGPLGGQRGRGPANPNDPGRRGFDPNSPGAPGQRGGFGNPGTPIQPIQPGTPRGRF
ncbi:MAG: type II secretion system protein [Acidobacteria bacterium]|nr:type II secretion system protein [Acidobacteriota bacterium]